MAIKDHKNNLHVVGFIRLAPALDNHGAREPDFDVLSRCLKRVGDDVELAALLPHEFDKQLRKDNQLKEVPIRLCFNKAENAISTRFIAFSPDGKTKCEGDGENATLTVKDGGGESTQLSQVCVGCESCPVAAERGLACRPQTRMPVRITGLQNSTSGVFEVRTSSYYTWRALVAQLRNYESMFGGLLGVPLKLTAWQMSNSASGFQNFDLMELALVGDDEVAVMNKVKADREARQAAGLIDNPDEVYAGWQDIDGATLNDLAGFYPAESAFPTHRASKGAGCAGAPKVAGLSAIQAAVAQAKGLTAAPTEPALVDLKAAEKSATEPIVENTSIREPVATAE